MTATVLPFKPRTEQSGYVSPLRAFVVVRNEDVHGNTGTGVVADGVIFPSGKVVLQWRDPVASVVIFDDLASVEAIHGHSGKTVVVFPGEEGSERKAA